MEKQSNLLAIIIVVAVAVVATAAILKSDSNSPKNTANVSDVVIRGGDLSATSTNYDFGNVPINGGLVNHEFLASNNSSAPIKVGRVQTSCMCTTAFIKIKDGKEIGPFGMAGHSSFGLLTNANLIVEPGETLVVRAIFDPAAHGPAGIGTIERAVYADTGGSEPLMFNFRATVTP